MLLPKLELKKGAKHLPGKTDVRGKLPQTPRNQLAESGSGGCTCSPHNPGL